MQKFIEFFTGLRTLLRLARIFGQLEREKRSLLISWTCLLTEEKIKKIEKFTSLPSSLIDRKIEQLLSENHRAEELFKQTGSSTQEWLSLAQGITHEDTFNYGSEVISLKEKISMLERKIEQCNNLAALLDQEK